MSNGSEDVSKWPEMDSFMKEDKCDVVFVIEGKRVPAVKAFLSFKSRVFRAMFSGEFKEARDKEVVVCDTTFEAFKTFIQCLYCDQLVLTNCIGFPLIEEVCKLSDRYDTPSVFRKMSDHLMSLKLSHSNTLTLRSITRIAFKYKLEEVIAKVMTFIDENCNQMIKFKTTKELIELNKLTRNRFMALIVDNHRNVDNQCEDSHMRCCLCIVTEDCGHTSLIIALVIMAIILTKLLNLL